MGQRKIDATAYNSPSGTFDGLMKEWYSKMLGMSIPNEFPEIDWLKNNKRIKKPKVGGKYIVFPFTHNPSSAADWSGENDYIPVSDQVDTVQGKIAWRKTIKARVGLTWEAMTFGKSGPGAFAEAKQQEFDLIKTVMRQRAVPAIWGNGDGVLGYIDGAVSSSASVTMLSSEVYNKLAPGTRWIFPGMKVISVNTPANSYGADSNMAAAVEVDSRNSNTSLTMTSPISATDAYTLVSHRCSDTSNSTELTKGSVTIGTANSSRWPSGFNAMCDDGTFVSSYEGISESSYKTWKAVVSHNSGTVRPFTTELGRELFIKLGAKTGDPATGLVCWMSWDMYHEYIKQLEPFVEFSPRKYQPGEDKFDMMFYGSNIPIKLSYNCPNYVYFLNPSYIDFYEHTPPSLADEDGSVYNRVSDKDSFEAYFRWGFQIGTHQRDRHGVLRDLDVSVVSI